MRNDRTNRLALLLVVFCCLGTTAMAMPATSPTVLSVVVGGASTHVAGELTPLGAQFGNTQYRIQQGVIACPTLAQINLEHQNLPPPLV